MQTKKIAKFISQSTFEDLPKEVINKAKYLILDNIGCALGGSQTIIGKKIVSLVDLLGGKSQSVVFGTGKRTSCALAAYANSEFANALDFDDTLGGHPGSTVIPPSLAVAEYLQLSGTELINAVVLGYEVQTRIGRAVCWKIPMINRPNPVTGSPWQIFGAVTSVSKLLSLTEREIISAIGIAGTASPIPSDMKCSLNPNFEEEGHAMVKNNYGYMSEIGVRGAFLAKMGYTGPGDLLEGDKGFWIMMGSDRCDFEEMTLELGESYRILNVETKPYSCCRIQHPIIDAALELIANNKIAIQNIEKIVVKTSRSQTIPPKNDYQPKTGTSVINSVPFSLAIALTGLTSGPIWFEKSTLNDPTIRALAKKIELVPVEQEYNVWKGAYIASVEITSRGKTFQLSVDHPKGSLVNPMSSEDLIDKFQSMAKPLLGTDKTLQIIDNLLDLETLKDVSSISALLQT